MTYKLTPEQIAIVGCDAPLLHVHAFAGTGKTSVLQAYAAARPTHRILYLAYNHATATEARNKFGKNVDCRTSHSLAYRTHGERYRDKLNEPRERDVMAALRIDPALAHAVLDTVKAYLHSAAQTFEARLVPGSVPRAWRGAALAGAQHFWSLMCDTRRTDVPMSHDGYLKLYALSKPDLSAKYDAILFDEAQDANPVTEALIRSQTRCTRVLVGDPHQSIYRFRGAVDALSRTHGAVVLPLTWSFRFSDEIANFVSVFLRRFKGEQRVLRGCASHWVDMYDFRRDQPYALICRTNAKVVERAFGALGKRRVHFVGGVGSYRFDKLLDVHRLASGLRPQDPFYASFASFGDFERYARLVKDKESVGLVTLHKTYEGLIPALVDRVKAEAVSQTDADLILTTTHKAKGLEFRQVRMALNDFEPLVGDDGRPREMATEELIEEFNLHYVAMTRATQVLLPNWEIAHGLRAMLREVAGYRGTDHWANTILLPSHFKAIRQAPEDSSVVVSSGGRQ